MRIGGNIERIKKKFVEVKRFKRFEIKKEIMRTPGKILKTKMAHLAY